MEILNFLVLLLLSSYAMQQPIAHQTMTVQQLLGSSGQYPATTDPPPTNAVTPNSQPPPNQILTSNQFSIFFDGSIKLAPPIEMISKKKCSKISDGSETTSANVISLDSITLSYSQYIQNVKKVRECSLTGEQKFFRTQVYNQNLKKINSHNSQRNRKYTMGLNQFTDLLEEEFLQNYAQLIIPKNIIKTSPVSQESSVKTATLPKIVVDWQCHSKAVVDQGKCGASHIISALQTIEIGYKSYQEDYISQLENLSVQEVLSCANQTTYGDLYGCKGGFFQGVFQFVKNAQIGRASSYPYSPQSFYAGIVPPCDVNLRNTPSYIINSRQILTYEKIQYNSCTRLVQSLEFRPISAAIYAKNLQFYRQGVFTAEIPQKETSRGWQGVTVLGYDPTNKFKIKNTWGVSWGIRGYAYADEHSGLCRYAFYPVTGLQLDGQSYQKCCNQISLISLI